jgi:hypothetical protein
MTCSRATPFDGAFNLVELTPVQKSVLKHRFMPLLYHLRIRTHRVSVLFHIGRIIVTVGSLIVPALLSIQMSGSGENITYWSTWTISLFVTICNALLTLFKLDKRYYYLHTCLEQLHSEGWQYIELSGKYSGFNTPTIPPTHANQFIYFCHAVEKIRMRQVEEEYFKMIDTNQPTATAAATVDSLVPPTPLKDEYKRMVAQMSGALTPVLDLPAPIVNGYRPAADGSGNSGKTEEESHTEGNAYRATPPVSVRREVLPTIPEGVGILFEPPGVPGRVPP